MDKEKTFELSRSTAMDLVNLIRRDISELKYQGIYYDRIMISIPQFYIPLLEHCLLYPGRSSYLKDIFGRVQIVPGYNNQICVFDVNASPNSPCLKPINIKFYG